MRKVIAVTNMTLDGVCDHTAVDPDEQIHRHYAGVLKGAGTILYGRITYELMEYWRDLLEHPSDNAAMNAFALTMDRVPKIVFSHSLQTKGAAAIDWQSARLARRSFEEEVLALKQEPGKDILLGSPGMIVQATNLGLVDEYQLCVHPVVATQGLPLFKNISKRFNLKLLETKTFDSGAVLLYYEPVKRTEP